MTDPKRITFPAPPGHELLFATDCYGDYFAVPAIAFEVEEPIDALQRDCVWIGLDGYVTMYSNTAVRVPDGRVFGPVSGERYESAEDWLADLRRLEDVRLASIAARERRLEAQRNQVLADAQTQIGELDKAPQEK